MDMDPDEFDFSGDELDDLPAEQLDELETAAIRATQHPPHTHSYNDAFDDDNADSGDEVVNLDDTAGPIRYEQMHHQQHYYHAEQEPPRQSQVEASHLLRRIKDLELEKRNLNTRLQSATEEANRKAGEAANLRRRVEQDRRDAERKLAEVERLHNEAKEQLRAEKDSIKQQLESTKTNNAFDAHDALQAVHELRVQRAVSMRPKDIPRRAATTAPVLAASPTTSHRHMLGDGFDDEDDAVMVSPSKRREKSRAATPRQTHKRKRQITNDSPIKALELTEPREPTKASPRFPPPVDTRAHFALLRTLCSDDSRYALLQRLLAHRCSNGRDRVLEALTQFAFPSQPEKKLSSIVYDSLSGLHLSPNAHDLALRICRVFFELWARCLREKHYAPISAILDALHFTLASEPPSTAVATIDQVIPRIVESVELVARPVFAAASAHRLEDKVAALYSPEQLTLASDINVEDCLELLYLVATSCVSSPTREPLICFWNTMPKTTVLLLLHRNQPLPQKALMLRILATSALPTSLGPLGIKPEDEAREQAGIEADLINRLTGMFIETFEIIPNPKLSSPETIPEIQVWQLRLKVLDVLTQFATTEHGCAKLANDHFCIGRLVRYLNHCVASLYTRPLSSTQPLKIASINATVKLIHHIISQTGTPIKSKLKGVEHAYQVAISRVTFAERLALEAGIESKVIDMAGNILDQDMGPEEGEAFEEVFPSGNSLL